MQSISRLVACAAFLALATSCVLAHGGTYTGPQGGGTPGPSAPLGTGATPGQPNPGNPNPGGMGGGVTPTGGPDGGNPTPGFGAPVRPGLGGNPRGNGRGGRGGTTRNRKGQASAPRYTSWEWWWDLNEERFLNLKQKVRATENASRNKDLRLKDLIDDAAPVTHRRIANDIIPTLKLGLKDPFYDARAAAVIALGKVGRMGDELIEDIVPLLTDADRRVRESACLGLGLLGDAKALPILLDVAKNTPAGKKLVGAGTGDVGARTRAFASVAIGLIGSQARLSDDVIDELLLLCTRRNNNRDVQMGPAIALQLLGRPDLAPALVDVVKDEQQHRSIRAQVALALGKSGATSTIPMHLENLTHKMSYLQYSSAISLGLLVSEDDHKVINKLVRHAESGKNRGTKNFCIMALAEIGGAKARAHLMRIAKKARAEHDRSFSCLALGVTGFKHKAERREMGRFVLDLYTKTKSDDQRAPLAIALGLLEYEPAREVLRPVLEGPGSQTLKGHVCTALGLINDDDSIPAVQELVRQKGDPDLRKRAAVALGLMQDSEAVKILEDVIRQSPKSKAILGAATVALGFIGDSRAVDTLIGFAENADKNYQDTTRAFALVALGFLGDKSDHPMLSKVHENSNYLTQTEALAELLSIL